MANDYIVVKWQGSYGALTTAWSNEQLEKAGFEIIDFYNNHEIALQEANKLNLAKK